jgi:AsmA protein
MKRFVRVATIVLGLLVLGILGVSLFVDANAFRPMLESQLTAALGRTVRVGDLKMALLSGGVTASDLTIADDPAFRKDAFLTAKSLRVSVEMIPLLLSHKLHITGLTIEKPEIVLAQNADGVWNFSSLGAKSQPKAPAMADSSSAGALDLSVQSVRISDGRLTLPTKTLQDVTIVMQDFSANSAFSLNVSGKAEDGGEFKLDGKAGPIAADASRTPFQATIDIKQLALSSGDLAGVLSAAGSLNSDGTAVDFTGQFKADKLKFAARASPAKRTVKLDCAIRHDLGKRTGTIQKAAIEIGKAAASLTGAYDLHGATAAINVKLTGDRMPLEELEAMLPAFNFSLPNGSSLKGGSATVHMAADGQTDRLLTSGSVRVENTRLAGFDLGSKMSTLQKLAGIKTGSDTEIQLLSADVKSSPAGTNIANLKLLAPAVGDLTGDGAISPKQELEFHMHATLHTGGVVLAALGAKGDTGVPFSIEGTTSNPVFKPDVKGMVGNRVKSETVTKAKGLLHGLIHK